MKEVGNEDESICITSDVWTSSFNDSYMALTGYYTDRIDGTMKSILLECVLLVGLHTGVNLAKMLRVIDEWKVTQKKIQAVTDNSAKIKKAVERI